MEKQTNKIKCPNCGQEIDVSNLLYKQLDNELREKYNEEMLKEKKKLTYQYELIEKEKEKFEDIKRQYQKKISDAIQQGLENEKHGLEKKLREKIQQELSEQIRSLQEELNQKSNSLKEFNKAKSEIERLKREKEEIKDAIEAESEKRINKILIEEKAKIRKLEEEKMQFKVYEKDQIILQLNKQLQEAQRKAEQGSMQLQGEVQELAIEDWLKSNFPLDTIEEIKKGAKGADCLQIVNTRTSKNCGSIYYESKRTKGFQGDWIGKFKGDIRAKGADIGVLVTESMPTDMDRIGLKDGVWICSFDEFKGLCAVLRESIIRLNNAVVSQENKGEKMGMLYDYLTSNEFRLQIEAIVEGFTQMQSDLESEKRSMQGIWKKREKQIQKVVLNTTYMYSSIKGIAGNAIQPIKLLELPNPENSESD